MGFRARFQRERRGMHERLLVCLLVENAAASAVSKSARRSTSRRAFTLH